VRWVYTIVFSEDFEQISDGKVQPYGSRGWPMAGQHFGNPSGPLQLSASVMLLGKGNFLKEIGDVRCSVVFWLPKCGPC